MYLLKNQIIVMKNKEYFVVLGVYKMRRDELIDI